MFPSSLPYENIEILKNKTQYVSLQLVTKCETLLARGNNHFAGSGHMVWNTLCWDSVFHNKGIRTSPTQLFFVLKVPLSKQHNLFHIM